MNLALLKRKNRQISTRGITRELIYWELPIMAELKGDKWEEEFPFYTLDQLWTSSWWDLNVQHYIFQTIQFTSALTAWIKSS